MLSFKFCIVYYFLFGLFKSVFFLPPLALSALAELFLGLFFINSVPVSWYSFIMSHWQWRLRYSQTQNWDSMVGTRIGLFWGFWVFLGFLQKVWKVRFLNIWPWTFLKKVQKFPNKNPKKSNKKQTQNRNSMVLGRIVF